MRLDKSPFVITSVVGQELLATGNHAAAVVVLESALRIGTCSLKLRGSVFSALSSAYWALNTLDRAIAYMQQDLAVAKSLGILLFILSLQNQNNITYIILKVHSSIQFNNFFL